MKMVDPKSVAALIGILTPVGRLLSHRFTRGLKLTEFDVDSGQLLNLSMRNTFGSPLQIERVVVHLPAKNQPLLFNKTPSIRADEQVVFQINIDMQHPVSVSFFWKPIHDITASDSLLDKMRNVWRRHYPTHVRFSARQLAAIARLSSAKNV